MPVRAIFTQYNFNLIHSNLVHSLLFDTAWGVGGVCTACQKRFKTRRFTLREDDLIQEALDDEFGDKNMCAMHGRLLDRVRDRQCMQCIVYRQTGSLLSKTCSSSKVQALATDVHVNVNGAKGSSGCTMHNT